jgi:hypothetical protein
LSAGGERDLGVEVEVDDVLEVVELVRRAAAQPREDVEHDDVVVAVREEEQIGDALFLDLEHGRIGVVGRERAEGAEGERGECDQPSHDAVPFEAS